MKIYLDNFESYNKKLEEIRAGDLVICQNMCALAQNLKQLNERINEILAKKSIIYFENENLKLSNEENPEQKQLLYLLKVFSHFEQENILKRRRLGIKKAKELGKYSKERKKKLPLDLREELIKEREAGFSVNEIIKKYHISRKTFYNYTQYATKNILKNISQILTEELKEK